MQITIWGCRGSIPVPGSQTVRYGGNTTCVEVRLSDGTLLVLDAGSGIRALGQALVQEPALNEFYLFLTHAHWDHLLGFPFFAPAYSRRYTIHVRGGPNAKNCLQGYLEQQMSPPYFPVPFSAMQARFDFTAGPPQRRTIGRAEIVPVPLSHPNGGYGFRISEGAETFVFLPDNELDIRLEDGLDAAGYADICQGADLLLHDAQYSDEAYQTRQGWGHSRVSATMALAQQAGVRRLGLFHHDPYATDSQIDAMAAWCEAGLRQSGDLPGCFAAQEGMTLTLGEA